MNRFILFALAWASVIIGVALAGNAGIISQSSTKTLVIVLPVLATISLGSMSRKSCCGLRA